MKPAFCFCSPLLLVFASCASIMTGSSDTVNVTSAPPGAYFTTNTGMRGHTPMNVSVPASQDLVIDCRMKGYEPQTVIVESRVSAWILGNVIFGGLIGLAIDVVNPDSRTHDSSVVIQLVPGESPAGIEEEPQATSPVSFPEPPREIEIRHLN